MTHPWTKLSPDHDIEGWDLINQLTADIIEEIKPDQAFSLMSFHLDRLSDIKAQGQLILIRIDDYFELDWEYSWWRPDLRVSGGVNRVIQLAEQNPQTKFLILTSCIGMEYAHSCHGNLHWVSLEGMLLMQPYGDLMLLKDHDCSRPVISLSRIVRPHRAVMISLLLSRGLDRVAQITAVNIDQCPKNIMDFVNWQFDDHLSLQKDIQQGWQWAQERTLSGEEPYQFRAKSNSVVRWNNADNWKRLRSRYQYSRIEIVNEPLYSEPYTIITEKYPFSVTAANFPVFVAPAGTVDHYRQQGFDMFDDIIDHDYDSIDDPILRMDRAINEIQRLTSDTNALDYLWGSCRARFRNNYQRLANARDHYRARIWESVRQWHRQLNIPATPRRS